MGESKQIDEKFEIVSELNNEAAIQGQNSVREKITRDVTYYMAAAFIANKDFPKEGMLPTINPPPFNNFGHQLLLDYQMLVEIVWSVIDEIQEIMKTPPAQNKNRIVLGVFVIVAGLLIMLISTLYSSSVCIGSIIIGIGGLLVFSSGSDQGKFKKEVAKVRANAIEKLIQGRWNSKSNSEFLQWINKKPNLVGNGTLDGDKVPVLTIINERQPFSGYGLLQAENLFVCKPKDKNSEDITLPTLGEIKDAISENITSMVSKYGIQNVSFGNVIVLNGNSLFMDSNWLDENKTPILWLEKEALSEAETVDERASIRVYFATQVLFPHYMTAATFFVRPFLAGNSASCQIAVTTIGPSKYTFSYFQKRLLKYRAEIEGETQNSAKPQETSSLAIKQLRLVRAIGEANADFQTNLNISAIKKLDPFEEEDSAHYSKEFKKAVKGNVMWPGHFTAAQNFREAHSLTFTNDFFGKTEARASVKTLYDQTAIAVIDVLDSLGFDVSSYKDSEGNYSINADKIDQLIIGEEIKIAQGDSQKNDASESKSSSTASTNSD